MDLLNTYTPPNTAQNLHNYYNCILWGLFNVEFTGKMPEIIHRIHTLYTKRAYAQIFLMSAGKDVWHRAPAKHACCNVWSCSYALTCSVGTSPLTMAIE